jgi:two-component system KDP operon response regulator KdpE
MSASTPASIPSDSARARRILVVDDERPIREAVVAALGVVCDAFIEADTAAKAIALAAEERPDLVILDLGLPDQDGVTVCREIRRNSTAPIVVVSARHSEDEKVRLLDAGADDYVTKPFGSHELLARVRAHLRRAAQLAGAGNEPVIDNGPIRVDLLRRQVTRSGVLVHLTPTEWALLKYMVAEAGKTLTHKQLFDAVWGREFGNPQQHLRVHITHLRRKIEIEQGQPRLIVTEPGVGYRFELPR